MNNYRSDRGRRDDRRDDRGSFRGRSGGGGGRREMFDAVCSSCGKDCKLPFQPSNDKPVYCSECFEEKGGNDRRGSDRRSGGRDFRGRSSGGSRQSGSNGKEFAILNKNVELMNTKLEKIISLLSGGQEEAKPEVVEKKKVAKAKPAKVKKATKSTVEESSDKEEKEVTKAKKPTKKEVEKKE